MAAQRETDPERGERIKHVRKNVLGMRSQDEFARWLGITRGAVGNWELGKDVGIKNLKAISKKANVPFEWLLTGNGEKPSAGEIESDADTIRSVPFGQEFDPDPEFVEHADRADAARRYELRQLLPGEVVEREVTAGMGSGGQVPVITVDGQTVDDVRAVWRLPVDFLHSELRSRESDVDFISVEGDSMIPTLLPGDRVLVNRTHNKPGDGLFVIFDGIGPSVKRLEIAKGSNPLRVRIKSDNPLHGMDEIEAGDLAVIGRVVCKVTRL